MPKDNIEELREALRQRQEAEAQAEDIRISQIGGMAYSGSSIEMDRIRSAHEVKKGREGTLGEAKQPPSANEQIDVNHDIISAFLELMPNAYPLNRDSRQNRGVYLIDSNPLERNFGAHAIFGADEATQAKRLQSYVLWVALGDVVDNVPDTPHLPYFVVGERSRSLGHSLLIAPLRLEGTGTFDLYARKTEVVQSSSTQERAHSRTESKGMADVFLVEPLKAIGSLFSRQKKGQGKAGDTALSPDKSKLYPLDVHEVVVPSGYKDLLTQRNYRDTDYTAQEIRQIYDPDTGQIVIDQDSPGSIRNGTRLGPLRLGKQRVVRISDARPANLGDKNFNKYNVWQKLVELAVVFGKHEELDELLAKID